MDLQLSGRCALVTGASSGIGQGIALALAAEGVRVAISARSLEALSETASLITAAGGAEPVLIAADLTIRSDVDRLARQARAALPGLDILVSNAGGSRPMSDWNDEAVWEEAFALNFTSSRRLTHFLIDDVKASGQGRILVVTGWPTTRNVNAASPAKAALTSWARAISFEIAPYGATINCLVPGKIESRQMLQRIHPTEEARADVIAESIPLGRFGMPAEFAFIATCLVSPRASYVNGASIPIDAGMARLA
ncbi:SDR family oxidoreductase [Chelativorans sp. Marseille-P2723]|uniref:SDR family oxidoreductase n=1 Tax=Chelativorans sp. Marseille-P2723 TaxID=2709133 RepID=UPI001570A08C|nr:SDR family oxidoreductase [Chelativorans sp. Marseille-P2723]